MNAAFLIGWLYTTGLKLKGYEIFVLEKYIVSLQSFGT